MIDHTFEIADVSVSADERKTIEVSMGAMVTHNDVQMTVHVVNGKKPGPKLFVCAAIHGDEINGVEIIRRLLQVKSLRRLSGTLVAIPIVNIHGFINQTRYLPDGRDLNRSFPGLKKGSLSARVADKFFTTIVKRCDYGIDLHTGARHRDNLPQIRADLSEDKVKALASAFGVPAIIDSKIRDGSLRAAAGEEGIPILLYEAGEALRFNELAIRAGVRGVLNVMRHLQMLPPLKNKEQTKAVISSNTSWVRAPHSGILRALVPLGVKASKDSVLGVIADPLGVTEFQVTSPEDGIVIGRTNLPLVNEGDALFHLAYYHKKMDTVVDQMEDFQERLEPEPTSEAPMEYLNDPIQ